MENARRGRSKYERIKTMWPFGKPVETRSNYNDAIVEALLLQATTGTASADGVAAVEAAAGLLSRGFASAEVTGADGMPISPSFLAGVGRDLIWPGESLHLIDVDQGEVRLFPISAFEVSGTHDPRSWFYRCEVQGPDGPTIYRRPGASILHLRYSVDPSKPWRGVGPLQRARISARILAEIESALADESSGTRGHILPTPLDGDDRALKKLRTTVAGLRGRTALVETMKGSWGADRADAPTADWRSTRLGFNAPDSAVSLCSDVSMAIMAATGCPPSLMVASSDGGAAREALRRWLHTTVGPLALMVQSELRTALDAPALKLSFDGLYASDLSGRARAFGSMVKAGLALDKAAALSGLMAADDEG